MFERSRHALLALLTEQFEVDGARLLFGVELDPEDHPALHRRPGVAAVLCTLYVQFIVKNNKRSMPRM